jgi:Xaa-Pro aminopeptidase
MPLGVYELLCKSLPDVELVDVTPEYERFRECKSPWEIGEIRRAFALATEAFQAMESRVGAGVKEVEIAATGEYRARSLGANGFAFQTIVAGGERSNAVVPTASGKILQEGETVMLGLSPRVSGYAGVFGYTMVVGNAGEAVHRCFHDLAEAY